MGSGETLVNAVVGAVVTVLLSFVGISAVIGGGVAGYLEEDGTGAGAKVGALSGAFATVPFVVVVFVAGALVGLFAVGAVLAIGVVLVALFAFVGAVNVGLGALGGYLGAYRYEDQAL